MSSLVRLLGFPGTQWKVKLSHLRSGVLSGVRGKQGSGIEQNRRQEWEETLLDWIDGILPEMEQHPYADHCDSLADSRMTDSGKDGRR
jgi:hypothetical protein